MFGFGTFGAGLGTAGRPSRVIRGLLAEAGEPFLSEVPRRLATQLGDALLSEAGTPFDLDFPTNPLLLEHLS